MSDTKEKVMNWIKHECLNHYGWREDYALEVLVGIIAGARILHESIIFQLCVSKSMKINTVDGLRRERVK